MSFQPRKKYFKKYQSYEKKKVRRARSAVWKLFGYFFHSCKTSRLKSIWEETAQGNILDLGCGEGQMTQGLSKQGFAVGTDICLPCLKIATKFYPTIPFIWGFGEELPFKDQAFDFILCSHVIEHVLNERALLTEIHRVMKKKGYLLISTPRKESKGIYSILKEKVSKKRFKGDLPFPYHIREYSVKDFTLTLKRAGFKPVDAIYDRPVLPDIPFRRTLHNIIFKISSEQIFLCTK